MAGDLTNKNAKLLKFKQDVYDEMMSFIEEDATSIPSAYRSNVPVVRKASMLQFPNNSNYQTIIESKGGLITASALADLFMTYARSLSAVRSTRVLVKQVRTYPTTSHGNQTYINQPSPWSGYKMTSLSADYALSASELKSAVETIDSQSFTSLGPGKISQETRLNSLIGNIIQALKNTITTKSTVSFTVTTCHSACHSSCHSSRGRR